MGDFLFGIVQDGLYERLQGRIARLKVVDVLLVDALAPMIGIGVVYTRRVVDGSTGRACGRGPVALCLTLALIATTAVMPRVVVAMDRRMGVDTGERRRWAQLPLPNVPWTCASCTERMRKRCTASSSSPRLRHLSCRDVPSLPGHQTWLALPQGCCCSPCQWFDVGGRAGARVL
jgi:hypothetical protein